MAGSESRLSRALDRVLPEDADHVALREQASATLRAHVGFEMAVWATVDPLTAMWTSCVIDGAPRDEALEADVFTNEYGVPDVLKLTDLAYGAVRADSLVAATGGDPTRSARFREAFAPRGISDELRLVCSEGGTPWGAVVLLRSGGRFTADEVAEVGSIGAPFAGRLRRSLLRGTVGAPGTAGTDGAATGLVLCRPDGRITEMTAEAAGLLAVVEAREVPAVVGAVVAKHRAGGGPTPPCPPRTGGGWPSRSPPWPGRSRSSSSGSARPSWPRSSSARPG